VIAGTRRPRTRIPLFIAIVAATAATVVVVAPFGISERLPRPIEHPVFFEEAEKMGKKMNIEDPGPLLTIEQITAFEKEIGGRLPEDYKQFLLSHNGGWCKPEVGIPWVDSVHIIPYFSPLLPAGERAGIRSRLRVLSNLNPEKTDGYLPIASTLSDCDICVAYRGKNAGAIFITAYKFKIEHANDDLIPIDVTMVQLADSFSEFLDYLVEIPDPYCPIEDLGKSGTDDDLARYLAEGNSIDALSKNGMTIVCEAIRFDNSDMLRACIARGASVSGSIVMAAKNRRTHMIEMLVKAGADINERDECGGTPLEYVGGTALPGEQGARNRELRALLIKLGAIE